MAGLLSGLFGQQQAPQAQAPGQAINGQSLLQKLLDPSFALPVAQALMQRGQGNMANFGDAFGQAGQAMAQKASTNKTRAFLEKDAPELAQMLDAGVPMADVLDLYKEQRKAQKPQGLVNAGEGKLYDPNNGSWITAPGGDEAALRAQQAQQYGLTPEDPSYQTFILTGKMPREDAQQMTATDKRAMWAAEDELPAIENTLTSLKRAKDLNTKTYTGFGAGALGRVGTQAPGAALFMDQDKAKATVEFGNLMSMEAITAMAQTLKGATTDQELNRFVTILADPATPPDIREKTLDRLIALAERQQQIKSDRIGEIRGIPNGGKPAQSQGGADWQDLGGGVSIRQLD